MALTPGYVNDPSKIALPSGSSWDFVLMEAMRLGKLKLAGPLEFINTASGLTLVCTATNDKPYIIKVGGQVEDAGAGRFLGRIIDGPINPYADGDLKPSDFGDVHADDSGVIAELWNINGGDLEADTLVAGWHIGNRRAELLGRMVLVVPSGGSIPKGQYQSMFPQMLTDNQIGYDYLRSHAMEDF